MWFTEFAGNRMQDRRHHGRHHGVRSSGGRDSTGVRRRTDMEHLWFTSFDGAFIGRMTPAGAVTLLNANAPNFDIVAGADGNLWYSGFRRGRSGKRRCRGSS